MQSPSPRSTVQYHAAQSQSLCSIILRRVVWLFCILLKGQSTVTRFWTCFSQYSSLLRTLSNGLKYFWFWLRLCWVIWDCLNAVWYYAESVSRQYGTALSQSSWSIILHRVTHDPSHFLKLLHRPLKGQYHKNKSGFLFFYYIFNFSKELWEKRKCLTPCSMILGRVKNILVHWSVAHWHSRLKWWEKKTEGQKYCWNVPKRDKKTCYKRNNFELAKSEHIAEREVILNVLCFYFNSIKLLLHRFY